MKRFAFKKLLSDLKYLYPLYSIGDKNNLKSLFAVSGEIVTLSPEILELFIVLFTVFCMWLKWKNDDFGISTFSALLLSKIVLSPKLRSCVVEKSLVSVH